MFAYHLAPSTRRCHLLELTAPPNYCLLYTLWLALASPHLAPSSHADKLPNEVNGRGCPPARLVLILYTRTLRRSRPADRPAFFPFEAPVATTFPLFPFTAALSRSKFTSTQAREWRREGKRENQFPTLTMADVDKFVFVNYTGQPDKEARQSLPTVRQHVMHDFFRRQREAGNGASEGASAPDVSAAGKTRPESKRRNTRQAASQPRSKRTSIRRGSRARTNNARQPSTGLVFHQEHPCIEEVSPTSSGSADSHV